MTAQAPFPQPQAPAKAEQHPDACEHGVRLKNHCCFCALMVKPRAFGWCGCTEDKLCDWHAPKEAK